MGFLRKTSGRFGAAAAAVVALTIGLVAFAAPASAHHSNIDASARCVTGEGTWRVSWTASTWSTSQTEGGHEGILVEYRLNGGAWTTVPNDTSAMPYADAALNPVQGVGVFRGSAFPSFGGTIDFAPSAVDQTVQVRSRPLSQVPASGPWFWDDNFILPADANTSLDTIAVGGQLTWRNGNTSTDGQTDQVTLQGGECQPPANPSAELQDECATHPTSGATGIRILLENTGGSSATFNVAGVGNVVVGAGSQQSVFVPVAEDAAYSVAVTVNGSAVPGSPIAGTRDCLTPDPKASLADECATNDAGAPGISVLLENDGTQGVTFDVEGVGNVAVGPGGSTTVFVAVAEDAAYSIDVRVGGEHVPGSPIAGTRDCLTPDPSASLADECAVSDDVEGIEITLTNDGDQGVTFNVEGIGNVVVGPNSSTDVFVPVAENSSYSVDVIALGGHVPGSPIAGTRDCRHPDPSAELDDECAVDDEVEGVSITLTNTGDDDATFQVDGGSDVVVGAGSSTTVFVPVAENSDYSITVTSGGQTVATIEGTRDCRHPVAGASVSNECAVDDEVEGIAIQLTNTGDDDATFQVDGGSDVVVGAGSSTTVFVPVAENSAYSITVTSGGQTVATFEGTRDCRFGVAGVSIAEECAEDEGVEGVELTLTNSGDDSIAFQVDGGSDIVVGAGSSTTVFVPVAENSDYSITVTAEGNTVGVLEGTRDCRFPDPSTELSDECAVSDGVEGVSITLTNTGDDDATFQVDGGSDIVVGAGESTTVFVPVDEDTDYAIEVTSGGQTIATFEGTRDCRSASPSASVVECAESDGQTGVLITLTNDGDQEATFQVDGGDDVVVPAESETTVFVPVAEDEAYDLSVTADGETVIDFAGTRDCEDPETTTTTRPTEVGGVQFPEPLPRTGSESSRTIVMGLALLFSGAGIVLLAADRRRAASR